MEAQSMCLSMRRTLLLIIRSSLRKLRIHRKDFRRQNYPRKCLTYRQEHNANSPLCSYYSNDRESLPAPRPNDMGEFPYLQRSTVMTTVDKAMAPSTAPVPTAPSTPPSTSTPEPAPSAAPTLAPTQLSLQQDKQGSNREMEDLLQILLKQMEQMMLTNTN